MRDQFGYSDLIFQLHTHYLIVKLTSQNEYFIRPKVCFLWVLFFEKKLSTSQWWSFSVPKKKVSLKIEVRELKNTWGRCNLSKEWIVYFEQFSIKTFVSLTRLNTTSSLIIFFNFLLRIIAYFFIIDWQLITSYVFLVQMGRGGGRRLNFQKLL